MPTFGERLNELRNEKHLTQEQLGKVFFLNKSSISRYEKNQQMPESDLLQKIADFFEVSVDYLLGKTNIKNSADLFNGAGGFSPEVINEIIKNLTKDSSSIENSYEINPFSIIIEEKLKEANLYDEDMSYDEKVALANKVLDILKLIKNK